MNLPFCYFTLDQITQLMDIDIVNNIKRLLVTLRFCLFKIPTQRTPFSQLVYEQINDNNNMLILYRDILSS